MKKLWLLIVLLLTACGVLSNEGTVLGRIQFQDVGTGAPALSQAIVSIYATTGASSTREQSLTRGPSVKTLSPDDKGHFKVRLAPGTYDVEATLEHFFALPQYVTVTAEKETTFSLQLEPNL